MDLAAFTTSSGALAVNPRLGRQFSRLFTRHLEPPATSARLSNESYHSPPHEWPVYRLYIPPNAQYDPIISGIGLYRLSMASGISHQPIRSFFGYAFCHRFISTWRFTIKINILFTPESLGMTRELKIFIHLVFCINKYIANNISKERWEVKLWQF